MNDQPLIPFPTILVYQQMELPHTKFWVVRYRPRNKESSSMTIMMRMFLKKYQCKWRLNCQVKALLIANVQLQLSWNWFCNLSITKGNNICTIYLSVTFYIKLSFSRMGNYGIQSSFYYIERLERNQ